MQALFSHLIVHRCKILNKALLYKQLLFKMQLSESDAQVCLSQPYSAARTL